MNEDKFFPVIVVLGFAVGICAFAWLFWELGSL